MGSAMLDEWLIMLNYAPVLQTAYICSSTGTARTATNRDRLRRPCPFSISWERNPVSGEINMAVKVSAWQMSDMSILTHTGVYTATGHPPVAVALQRRAWLYL
jgi:hypothetical protein